ncbi:EcoRII C terminal [Chitinophaga ginsengisegetis]|uniref:EcoRII C terminal n=1 Tax=Chitinophaga ginsengisegetis TaxID=393003 RepID=A0A1T5P760_9BACT|nr:type II restriction endonuclease [Chitinophaga ginsengisegetis]SKD08545.1 EcoRII C terminal [Chitinophaga ginsengisegetis]
MRIGHLSQYFEIVVAKTLRSVEVDQTKSNQHEYNGTRELKRLIRTTEDRKFNCRYIWLGEENESLTADGEVKWYNARINKPNRSPEYRLYFKNNEVTQKAKEGDIMFVARKTNDTLLIIISPSTSTAANQLYWLFNLTPPEGNLFTLSDIYSSKDRSIDFSARFILEEIGVEIDEPEDELINRLIAKFSGNLPSTTEFSHYARQTLPIAVDLREDPDHALLQFMNWEEKLFKRIEKNNIADRLRQGFMIEGQDPDVDGFINYSLSIQNRRKARAGSAFEEHIKYIFDALNISFSRGKKTENKSKPDFLFPDVKYYHTATFPSELLTMLGAKTSLKDRWRQVLSEATRITHKHLLTLEPGISEDQTKEMRSQKLQLVVPQEIHQTFTSNQRSELLTLKDFVNMILRKQVKSSELGYTL